jgi:hypothetical protein
MEAGSTSFHPVPPGRDSAESRLSLAGLIEIPLQRDKIGNLLVTIKDGFKNHDGGLRLEANKRLF